MPTPAPMEILEGFRAELARSASTLQQEICAALEAIDGGARFSAERWERPGGGGGLTRVLQEGAVFEKAGVNVSDVHGAIAPRLAAKLPGSGTEFGAAGLSVVVHPRSPLVPTAHMNVRFLARGARSGSAGQERTDVGGQGWFGGGADLTPYYLVEEDCAEFHRALRSLCERHRHAGAGYPALKRAADDYFFLPHRGEHRGVGGIFFDDLGADLGVALTFVTELPRVFLAAYSRIVARRKDLPYGEAERRWQEIRRGRYVEFNLVLDRGTLFGLETGGRTESVLMSLPPRVRFPYALEPVPGTREAALLEVLRTPREWT